MQQTSTTTISPDAFDMIASNFDAQKHRQPSTSSNSTDCVDGSSCSPGSQHGAMTMKVAFCCQQSLFRCTAKQQCIEFQEEPSSFSSNDTHLDAATTLSMMSHHIQSPGEAHPKVVQGIKSTPTAITQSLGWESESLPLHQPEGAFNQNDQENKGCSAKKVIFFISFVIHWFYLKPHLFFAEMVK